MPLTWARTQDGRGGHWWMAGEGPRGPLPSPPVTAGLSQPCQAHRSPATHTTHLGPSPWAGCRPGSWEADGALGGPGQGFLAGWGRTGPPGLGSIEWSPPPTKLTAEHLIVAPSLSFSLEVSLRLRGEWEPALSTGHVGQHQETPALLTPKHHPRTPSPSCAPHITHVVCFSPIPDLGGVCPPTELPAALWLTAQRLRDLHFPVIYQFYHSPKALGV